MIQFTLDHWQFVVQVVVFVVSAVGVYYRVSWAVKEELNGLKMNLTNFQTTARDHWDRQDAEFKRIEGRFEAHVGDPLPHENCPAHAQALMDIFPRLDRIQNEVGALREDLGQFKTSILTIMTNHAAGKK